MRMNHEKNSNFFPWKMGKKTQAEFEKLRDGLFGVGKKACEEEKGQSGYSSNEEFHRRFRGGASIVWSEEQSFWGLFEFEQK